ncbi:hypothetical protein ThvES_00019660, partial [Thiovulum sp. ES]
MWNKLKSLFNLGHKHTYSYISPRELEKDSYAKNIHELPIPNNTLKTILLMDDDVGALSFLSYDLEFLSLIRGKIRDGTILKSIGDTNSFRAYTDLYRAMSVSQIEFLKTLDLSSYNIVKSSGSMAGFSVEDAINRGLKVDIAILDIILGGYKKVESEVILYDGIDILKMLQDSNKSVSYLFYTGTFLGKYSQEAIKFRDLIGESLETLERKSITKGFDTVKRRLA